nr:hypothetical protein [Pseudotabrizicola alkalilacus]
MIKDHLHHTLCIPVHLSVPDPQNGEPLRIEPLIAREILWTAVTTAINFDHQPSAQIRKIRDERSDRRLSAEVQPQHPVQLAQLGP